VAWSLVWLGRPVLGVAFTDRLGLDLRLLSRIRDSAIGKRTTWTIRLCSSFLLWCCFLWVAVGTVVGAGSSLTSKEEA
jgi:hypothetical protein